MPSTASSSADWGRGTGERSGFQRYLETVREHWFLILACTVIALAGAAAYVKIAPKSYSATAELEAQATQPSDTVLDSLPVLHSSGDPTQDVLTASGLVTTPQVATAVAHALHVNMSASALLGKVSATPQGQSSIVDVQATDSSPRFAQELANAFVTQTVAVRTAAMHAAILAQLPALKREVGSAGAGASSAAGSASQQRSEYEQLLVSNDPTLQPIAAAQLPGGPSSPQTKTSLAAGLVGGLLVGIAAAFLFSALDPRLRREEQLREVFLGVPVLARIPKVGHRHKPRPLVPSELSFPAAEGYRTLRTTLTSRAGKGPQAYLVTGSAPAEGKTTTAIGLAAALAQAGGRVILIEADLRRPRIASAFGIEVAHGTEHVLIGEADLSDALVPVRVAGSALRVLAAHRSGAVLADRLSVPVARRLVQTAKNQADYVVIDSPPLTAVIDALPLAQLADDVIVVARFGQSRLAKLSDLEELLTLQAAPPTGLVLIGASPGRSFRYDYYAQLEEHERTNNQARPAPAGLEEPVASDRA
jgi:succinoglycan biosynthesis transport protein ExoP